MKFTHGIAVLDPEGKLLHFCGYEGEPKISDWVDLLREIANDPEFELTELKFGKDYEIFPAPAYLIEDMNKIMAGEDPGIFTVHPKAIDEEEETDVTT